MAGEEQQYPHILVFPYPAQGHILALLDLTHQLALRNVTITILVTPKNLQALTPLLSAHPTTIHTLVLPFPPHPAIPSGVENIRDIGNHGNIPTINALSNLRDPILRWLHSHPNPPVAIIADFFLGWAASLGLPFVSFSSISAFFTALVDDCWIRLRAPTPIPAVVSLPDLPGSPEFPYDRLPTILRLCRESNPETDLVTKSCLAGISSPEAIVVLNTFEAMEGKYLSHLRKKRGGGRGRVFAVGPVSLLGEAAGTESCRGSGLSPEVAKWLDGCNEGSVLYVCFGSQKVLDRQQGEALASGLEQSGVRFLWGVKTGWEGVPDGFEERVGGRGMVIRGWAPQVEILGHVAVGGFLSHCGWNSVLEGVAAGVRILAWPMEADQYVNARQVEDLGIAVRVGPGADWVPDPDELARKVAEAMAQNSPVKARAKELRGKALAAVREGGTSFDQLVEFVQVLRNLQKPVVSI